MNKSRPPKPPKPTDAELAILRVLWQRGRSTVREVWEQLSPKQHTGYTTVLKTMQIMCVKGLLARDESDRSHIYGAACSEEQTQRQVFSGSAPKLVMQALAAKRATPAELAEIRRLLDEMEGGGK
jgi:predicted transcriptional regulator